MVGVCTLCESSCKGEHDYFIDNRHWYVCGRCYMIIEAMFKEFGEDILKEYASKIKPKPASKPKTTKKKKTTPVK